MKEELHRPTIRVLEILETLAESEEGVTLTELSIRIGSSKGTLFPIIKTLVEYKYAHVDEALRYSLGFRSCLLASSFTNSNPWLELIHNEMQNLVDACDEVCQLGILDGDNVLYIDKIQSKRAVQLVSYIGKRLPANKTALGKTLLANLTDEQIKQIFIHHNHQEEFSVMTLQKLFDEIHFVRQYGYAIDDREINEETKCYAVSLCQGSVTIAALSVSLPYFRDTKEIREKILQQLFEKKQLIETAFNSYAAKIDLIAK